MHSQLNALVEAFTHTQNTACANTQSGITGMANGVDVFLITVRSTHVVKKAFGRFQVVVIIFQTHVFQFAGRAFREHTETGTTTDVRVFIHRRKILPQFLALFIRAHAPTFGNHTEIAGPPFTGALRLSGQFVTVDEFVNGCDGVFVVATLGTKGAVF